MSNQLQPTERAQVHVGVKSLHYRIYLYTQRHSQPKPYGYRENLCHYMRCIIIWAPLLWFFSVPIRPWSRNFGWVRPWMLAFLAVLMAGTAYSFYRWPKVSHEAAIVVGAVIGIIIAFIAVISGGAYLWDLDPKKCEIVAKIVTAPIWAPILGVTWLLVVLIENILEPYGGQAARWFFTKSYLRYIYPWMIFWVAIYPALYLIWGTRVTEIALITTGIILGIVGGILGLTLGVYYIFSEDEFNISGRIMSFGETRSRKAMESNAVIPEKGTSIFRIIGHWIIAKKWKICPFIILPDEYSS